MCMACNTGSKRKKIAILSSVGAAGAISAFALSINNPSLAAASAFLPLAICPAMCVAMGGAMYLVPRIGARMKPSGQNEVPKQHTSCCGDLASDKAKCQSRKLHLKNKNRYRNYPLSNYILTFKTSVRPIHIIFCISSNAKIL